jgi:hypothetical protein
MPLNLDSIVSVAESFMVDEITITRVTDADRHWNPSTGTESTTPQTIYTGKAFVSPMGSPGEQTYAAEDIRRTYYEIGAPRSMPAIKPNDRLIVTKCRYDPLLVGKDLCVEGIIPGTFTVHRRITAYLDQSAS